MDLQLLITFSYLMHCNDSKQRICGLSFDSMLQYKSQVWKVAGPELYYIAKCLWTPGHHPHMHLVNRFRDSWEGIGLDWVQPVFPFIWEVFSLVEVRTHVFMELTLYTIGLGLLICNATVYKDILYSCVHLSLWQQVLIKMAHIWIWWSGVHKLLTT